MNDSLDARSLLGKFRELRQFSGAENEFWEEFLLSSSLLCKSPVSVILVWECVQDTWRIRAKNNLPELDQNGVESFLSLTVPIAKKAVDSRFAFEHVKFPTPQLPDPTALCFLLDQPQADVCYLAFFLVEKMRPQQFNDLVVRTQLICDIPMSHFTMPTSGVSQANSDDSFRHVIEILSCVLEEKRFLLTCMSLVNDLAARFGLERVVLGWKKNEYIQVQSISHLEQFARNTRMCQDIEKVFEECMDQDEEVLYPSSGNSLQVTLAHEKYSRAHGVQWLMSFPMRIHGDVQGVLVIEHASGGIHAKDAMALRLALNHITPVLLEKDYKNRWFYERAWLFFKEHLAWWLGIEHTLKKLVAIVSFLFLVYSFVGQWDYEIEVVSTLGTDEVQIISAPFDGVIFEVRVHSGDFVKKGEELLSFDMQDFYLKQAETLAEINRYQREAQKARADNKLADVAIANAKEAQSNASLERINYFLKRSILYAPFDGIMVEGDRENLIGAPVSKGDMIFKIASPKEIYLDMKVPEKDIDEILVKMKGKLALLANPDEKYEIEVTRIVPMAQIDQTSGNVFLVRGKILSDSKDWWRPGMSGICKLYAGKKTVIWLFTHRIISWLRMYFWW